MNDTERHVCLLKLITQYSTERGILYQLCTGNLHFLQKKTNYIIYISNRAQNDYILILNTKKNTFNNSNTSAIQH